MNASTDYINLGPFRVDDVDIYTIVEIHVSFGARVGGVTIIPRAVVAAHNHQVTTLRMTNKGVQPREAV